MRLFETRIPVRLASTAAVVVLLALIGSCVDREAPTAPEGDPRTPEDSGETTTAGQLFGNGPLVVLRCDVSVRDRAMTCGEPEGSYPETVPGGPQRIIVGGQGTFLTLSASDISYDGSAGVFQMDVRVQNLFGQIFGSSDGSTVTGLKIFFHSGPTVTDGSGAVSVKNEDGNDNFTGSNQPFFEYSELLRDDETSSPRNWQLNIPNTVNTFSFEVFVNGDVPNPNGWVDVTPGQTGVAQGNAVTLTAQARDVVGRAVSRTYNWSSSNDANVSLSASSGSSVDATGNTSGASETITVSSSGSEADGTASVTVDGSDMAITQLRVGPDPVGVGGTLEYEVTIANNGPTAVTAAEARIEITGGHVDHQDIVSSSGGVSCSIATDNVNLLRYDCDFGDLAAGATNDVLVEMDPRTAATLTVDASILSIGTGGPDNNGSNDAMSRSVTSSSGPNLEADALTFTPSVPTTSQTVDIDGSITNTGDAAAGSFTWRLTVDGVEVASGTEGGLAAGGTFSGADALGTGPFAAGGRKAQLIVDTNDDVAEVNEDDNVNDDNLVAEGPGYDIVSTLQSNFDAQEQTAIQNAIDRWEAIITGDLPASTADLGPTTDHPVVHGVDDLHIFVKEEAIDGVGGTLAQAGPRFIRSAGQLSLTGVLTIDSADLDDLITDGEATDVITHEIGHILGIGTLWDNLGLINGEGTSDPSFTGGQAGAAFDAAGGETCYAGDVPVEQDGGSGTADSHWDEGILDTELMTGFAEATGTSEELSAITSESLEDLGYTIDAGSSEIDAYSVPMPCGTRVPPEGVSPGGSAVPFDQVLKPLFEVTADGKIIPLSGN